MPSMPKKNIDYAYTLQSKTKAVVFTQISLKPTDIEREGQHACIVRYISLFERHLKCRNVGLVYMYLSFGAEEIMQAIVRGEPLVMPPVVLEAENECLSILQLAENQARRTYSDRSLRFIYVTTVQLMALFNNLHHTDPDLFSFIYSTNRSFVYDSPQLVEAVIRIARGQDPRSAFYPIVRFDEDVDVCEKSLDSLLTAYEHFLVENGNLYFFFSGCYGDPNNADKLDPINDVAVRSHWFSKRNGDIYIPSETNFKQIKLFLRDLGEIGATQSSSNAYPSVHGQSLIAERGFTANRKTPQLISGAGQIVSLRCVQDLPPFMNMNVQSVWMNDHLPRQLYERIGDIYYQEELESVTEARFRQDRHPQGITQKDVHWVSNAGGYFDRLLAGCMMDALISQPTVEKNRVIRRPTEFTDAIRFIVSNPVANIDHEAMAPKLREYAERRYEQTLWLWQTPEFEGTVLYQWAHEKANDVEHKSRLIISILEDVGNYLELAKRWRVSFAAAAGRLRPLGNLWLFERVQ
jgi:hypothetical protein